MTSDVLANEVLGHNSIRCKYLCSNENMYSAKKMSTNGLGGLQDAFTTLIPSFQILQLDVSEAIGLGEAKHAVTHVSRCLGL